MPQSPPDRRPVADEEKQEFEAYLKDHPEVVAQLKAEFARRMWAKVPWLIDDDRYDGKIIQESGEFVREMTVYENCGIAETDFGCDLRTFYDHPYNDFSFEQLNQIADFDAVAAFILAERILKQNMYREHYDGDEWYQTAVNYYLRAAVLGDHSEPYVKMLQARNLLVLSDDYSGKSRHTARELYVWARAGADLGYLPPNNYALLMALEYFQNNPSVDPNMAIEKLNEEAEAIKQFLISLKANTTG